MFCEKCGTEITGADKICPKCGAENNNYIEKREKKEKQKHSLNLSAKTVKRVLLVCILLCAAAAGSRLITAEKGDA